MILFNIMNNITIEINEEKDQIINIQDNQDNQDGIKINSISKKKKRLTILKLKKI